MKHPTPDEEQDDLYAIAADWHGRVHDPQAGAREQGQLQQWLSADPRHAAAYRAVESMWNSTRRMAAEPSILELRQEALNAMPAAAGRVRVRRWQLLAGAAMVLIVAGVALFLPRATPDNFTKSPVQVTQTVHTQTFATAVGEQSTVPLADGSTIVLNTDTEVEVRFTAQERQVRLLSGQAWFEVAKNPERPFVVDAGGQRVTALGTAFDVRLGNRKPSVQVTLVEGRVSVAPVPALRSMVQPGQVDVLTPGDSLLVADTRRVLSRADIAKIISWRQGQILFDDDDLASAVAEMNRYSARQIVLADQALAGLRVSGMFKVGHSQSFIETVTGHYPITASERADGRVVLAPRAASH